MPNALSYSYLKSRFAVLGLVLLVLFARPPTAVADSPSFAKIYAAVKPSVVYVEAALPTTAASGTGFIYASTGSTSTIITANHVVEGATRIDVVLDNDLHKRYAATVQMRDHIRDVAVLIIQVGNRRALALADSKNVSEGMDIAVVGYPRAVSQFGKVYGDDLRPSVHTGIISAVRVKGEILQIDAQTDHGDSGGPIIDKATGNVVAIVRGALLDPSYVARGREQPLPGANFGMSVAAIDQVLSGAPAASSVAAAGAAGSSSVGTAAIGVAGAGMASVNVGASGQPSGSASSAAYRVGYGAPHYSNPNVEAISTSILERFANAFSHQSAFYMIPVSSNFIKDDGQQLSGLCDDGRLNAFVRPGVSWRAPLVYTASGAPASLETTVTLLVTDCSGGLVFGTRKQKTESTEFANRTTAKEVTDMSNDLLDQALADFEAFRASHAAMWDSLLQTGIGIDPADNRYHAMMFLSQPTGSTDIFVRAVDTGGPAARGGLLPGDIIVSINGTSVRGMPAQEAIQLTNAPQLTIVVRRPGGEQTLSVVPEKYAQLLNELKR